MKFATPKRMRRCKICMSWVDSTFVDESFRCVSCKGIGGESVTADLKLQVIQEVKAEVLSTLLADIKSLKRDRRWAWAVRVSVATYPEYLL